MIKRISQILVIVLLISLLSFVVWADRRKEVVREIDLKDEKSLKVRIEFGAGELNLGKNRSEKMLEVDISYEPAYSDFTLEYDKSKDSGELYLGTELEENKGLDLDDIKDKNWWDLRFTDKIPIDFEIDVGAAESEFDFTGLKIRELDIDLGAASGVILFRKPNPERISRLSIDAGASKLEIEGLGNANFKRMDFDGGVGDFTFDFSGDLRHQAFVKIDMGLGRLVILLPEDIGVKIESEDSFLSLISFEFEKDKFEEIEEDVWVNDQYGEAKGELNFEIEVGLGTVDIEFID